MDAGGDRIRLGGCTLFAVPAHFLHSVGNFQLYDPVSRILFSGDMGASMVDDASPVNDFVNHIPSMAGFDLELTGRQTLECYLAGLGFPAPPPAQRRPRAAVKSGENHASL